MAPKTPHSWNKKRYPPRKSPKRGFPCFAKAEIFTEKTRRLFWVQELGCSSRKSCAILLMANQKSGIKSPVEVGSLSHYLQGFIHSRWLFGISEPSIVSRWAGLLVDMLVNFAQRLVNIATLHRDKVRLDLLLTSSSCCWIEAWVLVSIIFYIHLYLVKIPILTNIR